MRIASSRLGAAQAIAIVLTCRASCPSFVLAANVPQRIEIPIRSRTMVAPKTLVPRCRRLCKPSDGGEDIFVSEQAQKKIASLRFLRSVCDMNGALGEGSRLRYKVWRFWGLSSAEGCRCGRSRMLELCAKTPDRRCFVPEGFQLC